MVLTKFCLSSHVRGFDRIPEAEDERHGFIPACAGFCVPESIMRLTVEVHPRMCGVLRRIFRRTRQLRGSSPHVRGFARKDKPLQGRAGFIPACAGFCRHNRRWPLSGKVHPRMCGVLVTGRAIGGVYGGSSPHVRGFERKGIALRAFCRFIPACAGFCFASCPRVNPAEVHPRMCGVLFEKIKVGKWNIGSSPHVRGFGGQHPDDKPLAGFIPACAGF